jgi:PadR family transcriptional regulator, regulatory protein PadR
MNSSDDERRPGGADLLQGTLDMLILKAVSLGSLPGYGILLRIQQLSRDALRVPQGSLYPALYRLEAQGLIEFEWGESANRRRAKLYRLTARGRRRLESEQEQWQRAQRAVGHVLAATAEEA